MAAPGANLQFGTSDKVLYFVKEILGLLPNMRRAATSKLDTPTAMPRVIAVCCKNGVPATNTAADAPTGIGDLCVNMAATPRTLYRCTAYTNTTTFTWTQIA